MLCDWIVAAAQSQGLGVQATQIPGVAQRTGATTYYLEVMPSRAAQPSVLALNPAIGEVDVALATELLEAGRMIFNGFVTPDRTTLIASTHRVLAIGERTAMGDGSFDVGRLLRAVKERSKAQILFDMDQAAEEVGGVINAVLLGALAGSGRLPIPDAAFETAIRHGGKAVDTNLAAFAFGRGHARGELEQACASIASARRRAGRRRSARRAPGAPIPAATWTWSRRACAASRPIRIAGTPNGISTGWTRCMRWARPSCCARRRGIWRSACRSRT